MVQSNEQMQISTLKNCPQQDNRQAEAHADFEKLIAELKKRTLSEEVIHPINWFIEEVNSFKGSDQELMKILKDSRAKILKLVEKEFKLVPKNHYRNLYLAVGMASFGIPLGVIFGLSLGNMAFIGIGLPIGMGIGIAVGTALDKKARDSGKQLDLKS
jgi:hypothetical protein